MNPHPIQIGDYQPELCTCGKRRYPSRKEARRAARTLPRGNRADRTRAYQCAPGIWHIGHHPTSLRNGAITRDEYNDGIVIATKKGKCLVCYRTIEPGEKIHPNSGWPHHTECPHPL